MLKKVIIGSRGSALALIQSNWTANILKEKFPHLNIEIKKIKTKGDKILDAPLSKIGDKGLFVKEIEEELLSGKIDLAVHSMKDLPTKLPPGLIIAAVPKRIDPRDCLISYKYSSLEKLPKGATLGTSSLRRKAQILHFRKDLAFLDLRGNLTTRLEKLEKLKLDGIILAAAGIIRMGINVPYCLISDKICLPAVGQGALAIESKENNQDVLNLLNFLNHFESYQTTLSERAFMLELEGGCQIPIGAHAEIKNNQLILKGVMSNLMGTKLIKGEVKGKINQAKSLGTKLAKIFKKKGAEQILREIKCKKE